MVARINKLADRDISIRVANRQRCLRCHMAQSDRALAASPRRRRRFPTSDFLALWRGFAPVRTPARCTRQGQHSGTHIRPASISSSRPTNRFPTLVGYLPGFRPQAHRTRSHRRGPDRRFPAPSCATAPRHADREEQARELRVETGDVLAAACPVSHFPRTRPPTGRQLHPLQSSSDTHSGLAASAPLHGYPLYFWKMAIGATFRNRLALTACAAGSESGNGASRRARRIHPRPPHGSAICKSYGASGLRGCNPNINAVHAAWRTPDPAASDLRRVHDRCPAHKANSRRKAISPGSGPKQPGSSIPTPCTRGSSDPPSMT